MGQGKVGFRVGAPFGVDPCAIDKGDNRVLIGRSSREGVD